MTLPPRLHLSRHGIYYFRAIVPRPVRTLLRLKSRELRISLRTTDLRRAKTLLAEKNYIMSKHWEVQPWEIDAEKRQALYEKGLKLIKQFGAINLNNQYQLSNLSDELGSDDLKAYIFAKEYLDSLNAKAPLSSSAASPSHGSHVAPSPKTVTLEDATFEKALQRFEQAKKLKANSATVDKYVSHCRLFLKIISDEKTTLKLSEMQASHIQHYRDIITTLPRKVDPSDSRPITEWLQSAGPRMAPRTLFSHVQSVCMFLGWCKDQQYMVNPAFDAILKDLRKKPKPKKIRRRFTSDELEIIFEPNRYCQFKRDSDYWVPLIALFTGAREAEICQLLIQDVILDADTGLWYLDINDESEIKKVKTESSRRHVPIHRCLLEIGLLDYREARIASQETTLFDETRSNRGEFSAFSKRFNRYRCGIGLETNHQRDLDFHSFRHTVQHQLYDIHGCEEYLIKEIIGHERSGDNEGLKTYSEGASLSKKFEVISKLEYSLPYDELKSRTTNVPVKPSAGADRSHK